MEKNPADRLVIPRLTPAAAFPSIPTPSKKSLYRALRREPQGRGGGHELPCLRVLPSGPDLVAADIELVDKPRREYSCELIATLADDYEASCSIARRPWGW